jgi:hypothetical protein
VVPLPAPYAASMLKGSDLGSSSLDSWIFINSSIYRSCRILSKYGYITNYALQLILLLTSFSAVASSLSCIGADVGRSADCHRRPGVAPNCRRRSEAATLGQGKGGGGVMWGKGCDGGGLGQEVKK